jgi:fructose-specific phosphotransferase system component IIB
MSTTTTNKKNKSRGATANSSAVHSSIREVNQKSAPYQVRPSRYKPNVLLRNQVTPSDVVKAASLIIKTLECNVEAAYNEATKGMPKSEIMAMVHYFHQTIDQIAERNGVTEAKVSPRVQQENKRFIDNLKNEAESARAKHIASKKLLPPSAFQEKLGISKQAISKAIKENRMFAVLGPSGENFYPAFFAEEKYDRRHLEKVCKALGTLPGGSKWQFFTTAKGSLDGRTPLEALAVGEVDAVIIAADGFVER